VPGACCEGLILASTAREAASAGGALARGLGGVWRLLGVGQRRPSDHCVDENQGQRVRARHHSLRPIEHCRQ